MCWDINYSMSAWFQCIGLFNSINGEWQHYHYSTTPEAAVQLCHLSVLAHPFSSFSSPYRTMLLVTLFIVVLMVPAFITGGKVEESHAESSATIDKWTDFWIVRITLNLLSYATLVIPGYLVIRYVRNSNYLDTASECGLYRNRFQLKRKLLERTFPNIFQ